MNSAFKTQRQKLSTFLSDLETSDEVAMTIRSTAIPIVISNPYSSQEQQFEQFNAQAQKSQLMQITFATKNAQISFYLSESKENIDKDALKYLLTYNFDIYKYFKYSQLLVKQPEKCKDCWTKLLTTEQAVEMPAEFRSPLLTELKKKIASFGDSTEFEFEMVADAQQYEQLFQYLKCNNITAIPSRFEPCGTEKIHLIVKNANNFDEDMKQSLEHIDADLLGLQTVLQTISSGNKRILVYNFAQQAISLLQALTFNHFDCVKCFGKEFSKFFPNYIDLARLFQQPQFNSEIAKIQKEKQKSLKGHSLQGYYEILTEKNSKGLEDINMIGEIYQAIMGCDIFSKFVASEQYLNQLQCFGQFEPMTGKLSEQQQIWPIYPIYQIEEKTIDYTVRKAVQHAEGVVGIQLWNTNAGACFVDQQQKFKPVKCSCMFTACGQPRKCFQKKCCDGLLQEQYGRIMKPAAARELYEKMQEYQNSKK